MSVRKHLLLSLKLTKLSTPKTPFSEKGVLFQYKYVASRSAVALVFQNLLSQVGVRIFAFKVPDRAGMLLAKSYWTPVKSL